MSHSLQIQTGSRLHFGPLTNGRQGGRLFGGIGMMIDSPQIEVAFALADEDSIDCPETLRNKVIQSRDSYRDNVAHQQCPSVSIHVDADATLHSGMGTGTQLAMSIAHGLDYIYGNQHPLDQLASFVGRGKRSALGVHGFERGGFLVDGGKRQEEDLGALVAQCPVSPDWRVLLITPPDLQGLSGEAEEVAFKELSGMPREVSNSLSRLVLMEILPALQEADFPAFSKAIHEYGAKVGDYFGPIQGGRYSDPKMRKLVQWLLEHDYQGVGQTSWGPTIFAFCDGPAQASHLKSEILYEMEFRDCRMEIAQPLNSGAQFIPASDMITHRR